MTSQSIDRTILVSVWKGVTVACVTEPDVGIQSGSDDVQIQLHFWFIWFFMYTVITPNSDFPVFKMLVDPLFLVVGYTCTSWWYTICSHKCAVTLIYTVIPVWGNPLYRYYLYGGLILTDWLCLNSLVIYILSQGNKGWMWIHLSKYFVTG